MDLLFVSFLSITIVTCQINLDIQTKRAVKGSHQRYVLATARRIVTWAQNLTFIVLAILSFNLGFYISVFLNLFAALYFTMLELKNDDDDWFTGRWGKLKKGIKNYVSKLHVSSTTVAAPSAA